MARLPRNVIPGEPLHIMHRGNNRQGIFQREEDYYRFLEDLKATLKQYDCDLHAYVLMTNHFHFLLTPHTVKALSGLMQSIGRRYVRYVNKEYSRSGTLWEGRFKSSLISQGEGWTFTSWLTIMPVTYSLACSLRSSHLLASSGISPSFPSQLYYRILKHSLLYCSSWHQHLHFVTLLLIAIINS